jgi:hypothetical protein
MFHVGVCVCVCVGGGGSRNFNVARLLRFMEGGGGAAEISMLHVSWVVVGGGTEISMLHVLLHVSWRGGGWSYRNFNVACFVACFIKQCMISD